MKIKKRIAAIILLGCCAGLTTPAIAQKKNKLKKGPNISLNISAKKDSIKTTYLNLGLLTNIYRLQGVGINAISSVVQSDMTGFQVSGLASITGRHASGIQLGGIANVAGANANGVMLSGLMNVAGNRANGIQISGLGNIAGNTSRGVTIGGLMNLADDQAQGLQIAGLANIAGKSQSGIAIGGLMNVSAEKTDGAQISSILNISGGTARGAQIAAIGNVGINVNGMQLSAISNIAAAKIKGLQLCGAVNIAVETKNALQVSGITNVCQGKLSGIQFAPGNYAGEVSGAQIGLLNLCGGHVNGVQIGIINHSKDTTAHKIGLVNINPKTRIQLMLFGGNTSKMNAAVRFKNRTTYTLLGIGTHYLDLNDKFSGCVFYRAGLHYPIAGNLEISGDLGYFHIENFENEDAETPERMYSLQARVNLEYKIRPKFSIFASGGYGMTRYYDKNKFYEKKPIIEIGVVLF